MRRVLMLILVLIVVTSALPSHRNEPISVFLKGTEKESELNAVKKNFKNQIIHSVFSTNRRVLLHHRKQGLSKVRVERFRGFG